MRDSAGEAHVATTRQEALLDGKSTRGLTSGAPDLGIAGVDDNFGSPTGPSPPLASKSTQSLQPPTPAHEGRQRVWPPPHRRAVTRETSLSSTCLFSVEELEENGQDLSAHGPKARDCVSGLLPFDQYEVDILVEDEALVVDFSTTKTTRTAQLHAATLEGKPVTSKRLIDNLAGDPTSLQYTALLLEAKALTALNRDAGHPAVPVIYGVSMRQTWSPVLVLEALYGPTLTEFFASVRTPLKYVARKSSSAKGKGGKKGASGSDVTGGEWTARKATVYAWSMQLLSALVHLHAHGVVHSDICTDTVVLTEDLRHIKVTSFEKAVVFHEGDVLSHTSGSSRSSLERILEAEDSRSHHRRGSRTSSGCTSPTSPSASPSLEPTADPETGDRVPPMLGGGSSVQRRRSFAEESDDAARGVVEPRELHLTLSKLVHEVSLRFARSASSGDKPSHDADPGGLGDERNEGVHAGEGGECAGGGGVLGLQYPQHHNYQYHHHHLHTTDAQLLAYSRDHFARRDIEQRESEVMRSHGDPKADVFQCAMLMWEIAAGRSPQHPSVQTHIPQYAKRQLPPSLMRTSGFLARVNFAPDTHYRPDLRVLPWKQFRSLVAEGWNPDAEKRSSAAELLRKLQTLPGRPRESADPAPSAGSADVAAAGRKYPCAACAVQ